MPRYAAKSIANLDQIVYLNTTLNTGHAHGLARETIILPVLARDEEPQPTTQESMFNYIRLSDGGPRRHEGTRSEIDVIASIAERVARPTAACSAGVLQRPQTKVQMVTAQTSSKAGGCRRWIGRKCVRLRKSAKRFRKSFPASNRWPRSIARSKNSKSAAAHFTHRNSRHPMAAPGYTCTICPTSPAPKPMKSAS